MAIIILTVAGLAWESLYSKHAGMHPAFIVFGIAVQDILALVAPLAKDAGLSGFGRTDFGSEQGFSNERTCAIRHIRGF